MLTRRASGFTLIELAIGLVLLGLLVTLALPSFTQMMHNMKLRASAEGIVQGLQAARNEALRRNASVEFFLTDDDPIASSAAGANVNTTGPNWLVRTNLGGGMFNFVEGRSGREGQGQTDAATLNVQFSVPSGITLNPALPSLTPNAITFNGLGRAELASNVTFYVTDPAGGACKTAGGDEPVRCLNVVVTPGGRIRMCDPSIADTKDSRSC